MVVDVSEDPVAPDHHAGGEMGPFVAAHRLRPDEPEALCDIKRQQQSRDEQLLFESRKKSHFRLAIMLAVMESRSRSASSLTDFMRSRRFCRTSFSFAIEAV